MKNFFDLRKLIIFLKCTVLWIQNVLCKMAMSSYLLTCRTTPWNKVLYIRFLFDCMQLQRKPINITITIYFRDNFACCYYWYIWWEDVTQRRHRYFLSPIALWGLCGDFMELAITGFGKLRQVLALSYGLSNNFVWNTTITVYSIYACCTSEWTYRNSY